MDQLAAAAAASYVTQPGPPPGPQPTPQPQQVPGQMQPHRGSSLVDTAVQTDVTTVVQSKQEMARAQIAAANRLLASTSSITFNSCEYCGRVFAKKEYLRRHVRIHTGERPYRCVVCQLSFRRSHHLRRHELMHTDIKPFACHLCEKAFKQKQHLDRHLTSHTDLKPFACHLCEKAFKQKQHLDRHLTSHSDIKPFACSVCDKAFKQKQHLDRHLTSHSGEKPFACHMCEKAFTRKQHLDRHIKMHTGELERTYKCHVCEKMFFRSHHRDKHLKSHGIAALETKNRTLNFLPLNIDLTKPVEALAVTSPHSGSSDSDTTDDEKPPNPDKQSSQVSKLVEGCRKRKTHSPVRLAPGEKKNRVSKSNSTTNTTTNTATTPDANGQPGMQGQRSTFDYSGMRNDIVFPRNEAVNAMAIREAGGANSGGANMGQQPSTSSDSGMQTPHHLGNGSQAMDALQQQQQQPQQQQHFTAMGAMNCLSTAQLQQMMAAQRPDLKVDGSTQHQEAGNSGNTGNSSKNSQPLVVPTSHFTSSSKMADIQQPKYTSAAAAIAGRQLQQAGVGMGVGMMEQPVHFKSVVGTQAAGAQAWPPALNWPPRLSLMPDGSLQGMPALTTYGTVNMADLNQVSGAAMYTAQKAMEMRMGLHRSPSLGGDAWVPVSVPSDRDAQRGAPSANDRRIYSPQPPT